VEAAYAGWRRRLAWRRRSDVSCVQLHALCYDIIGDDAICCNIGEIQILACYKLYYFNILSVIFISLGFINATKLHNIYAYMIKEIK